MNRSGKAALATVIFAIIFLFYLVSSSKSFQECEHKRKNDPPYEAIHKENGMFVKPVVRLILHVSCSRFTASENDGAITALASIAVAIFTFTLWRSTEKLWAAAQDSRNDIQESIRHAARSATAAEEASHVERAWITFQNVTLIHENDKRNLGVDWINSGRSPAINMEIIANHKIVGSLEEGPPKFLVHHEAYARKAVLGQRAVATSPMIQISPDDLVEIRARRKYLVLFSCVIYNDVFKKDIIRISECTFVVIFHETIDEDGTLKDFLQSNPIGDQNGCT